MSNVTKLHEAVKRGDIPAIKALLDVERNLANAASETDPRVTFPLHVAAEFGQAAAARVLLEYGADVWLLDAENHAIALGWAAFFGRPEVVAVLLESGSERANATTTVLPHWVAQSVEHKANGSSFLMPRWKTGKRPRTSFVRMAEWSELHRQFCLRPKDDDITAPAKSDHTHLEVSARTARKTPPATSFSYTKTDSTTGPLYATVEWA